jgi:hypothetical protein
MPFTFDPVLGRYRDSAGRLITERAVRGALDQVIVTQIASVRQLSQGLLDGRLSLAQWQLQMMQEAKAAHLVGLSVGHGGWNQLNQSDFGWAGQRIRSEYRFLDRFARDIVAGRQALDGTLLSRASMYAEAGRATHRAAQARQAKQRGMEQERNVLGAADHCGGCLSASASGWVAIGTLTPCGSRTCRSRCHCSLSFRVKPAA